MAKHGISQWVHFSAIKVWYMSMTKPLAGLIFPLGVLHKLAFQREEETASPLCQEKLCLNGAWVQQTYQCLTLSHLPLDSDIALQLSGAADSQGFRIAWAMTRADSLVSVEEIDAEGRSSSDITLWRCGEFASPSTDVRILSTMADKASGEVEEEFIAHLWAQE
ncbi:hypothetical protein EDD17DRAFT_1515318 [Pisolithus thermaeus]|nr:hypothetical protein EDD17DRAFT_1515318 [Pisolithus thermaeus]